MYSRIPKRCPDCGNRVISQERFSTLEGDSWLDSAIYYEITDEGRSTIGYGVICYRCNKGVNNG